MALGLSSADAAGFKILLALAMAYGLLSYGAYNIIHMRHVTPLGPDAPLDRFSEARALDHLRRLSVDIDGRQEGRPGLEEAARYIKGQLEALAQRAGPDFSVEVEETCSSGSFNMMYLHHSISLGYKNHKNLIMRISSKTSNDNDPSVLVNGHFDSPVGSPGAGDCGSCVASMLEMGRLIIDSNWIPPRPIIFLFNGAEELFLLGSHGFITTHKWSNTIGAFINIEASGTGGLDLVCRSGPGSWPSLVYAKSAKYPMAISVAQDFFGTIPGDTDYRILAEDYGHIPGLDIIFVIGGYFYHTSYDTMERLLPGSIQARGENLFNLLEAFTNSSMLLNAEQRSIKAAASRSEDKPSIYYDYLTWFMVTYSRRVSLVLHSLPAVLFFLIPLFWDSTNASFSYLVTFSAFMKGMLFHVISILLAVIVPVLFAILRLIFSSNAMCWFGHPFLAFLMFVPSSIVGLLLAQTLWKSFPISQYPLFIKTPNEALFDEVHFWGVFGLYGFLTMAYLLTGFGGGFLTLMISLSMFLAWFSLHLTSKLFGYQSFRSLAGYIIPLIPCVAYLVYIGGLMVQFVIEKMGMMGSLPQPYGYLIPDSIVAAAIGMVVGGCMGPLLPVLGHRLARASIVHFLVQVSVLALAFSSQFFPYNVDAPKRVVLQQTIVTTDTSQIVESSYDFSVVDANSLNFLFKHAPEVAKTLQIDSDFSPKAVGHSERYSWVAVYPLSFLFSGSLKFPAKADDILMHYKYMPHLSSTERILKSTDGSRRVYLELYLGSLQEIWGTVLNITGPLSNWSFADNKLPAPEAGGGRLSYICKLSGSAQENWTFWLEANSSEALRVDVAVLDQYLAADTEKLKSLFPSWADVTAFSTFFSTYYF